MRPFVLPFLALSLLPACASRYYCGPGTHVEGDWCVADGGGKAGGTDTGTDTGSDTGLHTDSDTAVDSGTDSGEDSGEAPVGGRLVINELMASNTALVADEHGEYDDWLELYNVGDEPVALGQLSLTDIRDTVDAYTFPVGTRLAPGAWLVVWCDGQPEQGEYHASFTLQSAGDQVYLLGADGTEVIDAVDYTDFPPEQAAIRFPDGSETWAYTANATPGAANKK